MRVTGTNLIQGAINVSPNSPKARELRAWLSIVRSASWLGPGDVIASFTNATSQDNIHWNFPLPAPARDCYQVCDFFLVVPYP